MNTPVQKTKGLRIATRCSSVDQFIAAFNRFCDEQSFFVSTLTTRPVGLETPFSVDLVGGAPALRGIGIVIDAWTTGDNRFGRPGVHLGVRRLTADSEKVFEKLLIARAMTAERAAAPIAEADNANTDVNAQPLPPPLPARVKATPPLALPVVPSDGERTPGSELVLPANPLTGIPDESLEGFVDCTLYEGTGSFFPVDPVEEDPADPVAPPPELSPMSRSMTAATTQAEGSVTTTLPAAPHGLSPNAFLVQQPRSQVFTPPEPLEALLPPVMEAPPLAYDHVSIPIETVSPLAAPPPIVRAAADFDDELSDEAPRFLDRLAERFDRRTLYFAAGIAAAVLVTIVVVVATKSGSAKSATPPETAAATPSVPTTPPTTPHVTTSTTHARTATATEAHEPDPPDLGDATTPPIAGSGPCRLTVTSTPAGSTIQLDGQAVGPSPITFDGPCQRRQVTISHARYQPETRTVALSAAKPQTIDVTLSRPTHQLMIETTPLGATISIAGRRAGTTPTIVEMMGFTSMTITISKPGYQTVTKRIYSRTPKDKLSVKLTH